MRILLALVLLLLLSSNSKAQERIPQSVSMSIGHQLTKGFHLAGHYHINSYDEFRLEYSNHTKTFNRDTITDFNASVNHKRISLNYVKGFRLRSSSFNKLSLYVGSGLILGKERLSDDTSFSNQSIGLRLFGEIDVAVAKKISLYLRYGNALMFTEHLGKNGAIAIGIRGYL